MRKFFFRFFLVTAVLSVAASAQTAVDGQLHDSGGKAVAGANFVLQRAEARVAQQVTGDAEGKFRFAAVEAGAYTLKAGFYPASCDFVARARQPLSLTMDLQRKEAVQQSVEVKAEYLTVDPEKTGSSYTFTQQDLEKLPDPLVDTTSDLVNNLMPGASDSHDNFLWHRVLAARVHQRVSFLDNTQPQFSPGTSPQIFETVDLMTEDLRRNTATDSAACSTLRRAPGPIWAGTVTSTFVARPSITTISTPTMAGRRGGSATIFLSMDSPRAAFSIRLPHELFDFGKGTRATIQLDWRAGNKDSLKLLLMGGGDNFQQPNIGDVQEVARDAHRHLRQQTAILTWLHTFSAKTLLSTSICERTGSDRVLSISLAVDGGDQERPFALLARPFHQGGHRPRSSAGERELFL